MKKNSIYIVIFSILAIYTIVGFVAIPKLLKPQLEKIINENITQTATIEKIEFNPFLLKFTLQNLKIFDEKETTAQIEKLYFDFSILRSIDEQHIDFKDLKVENPYINIVENENGTFNLQNLIKQTTKAEDEKEKPQSDSNIKFQIYKTVIDNARIDFTKLNKDSEPYKLKIDNFNYTFYDMGTFRNALASHSLRMVINQNSELTINGGLRLNPFKMYGTVELNNIKPNEFLSYKKDLLNFKLSDETFIDLNIGYSVDNTKDLNIVLNDGYLSLSNFDIKQNEESLLSLKNLAIDNINLKYPQNMVSIDSIIFNKLNTNAIIDKSGKINFSKLVVNMEKKAVSKTKKTDEVDITEPSKTNPWQVSLNKLDILDTKIKFDDIPNSLFVDIEKLNLNLKKFIYKNENISINDLKIANESLNFKDLKKKLTLFTKKSELDINNIKKEKENTSISNITLKNPSIYLLDSKNDFNVLANSLIVNTNSLNIISNDLNLQKANLSLSSLKFNDKKAKLDITTKNININATETSFEKEKLNIKNITLSKPSVYFVDNKNDRTAVANDITLKLDDINGFEDVYKIAKINFYQPSLTFKDNVSKANIVTKNINLNINSITQKSNKLKIVNSSINKPYISITLGKKEQEKTTKNEKIKEVTKKQKSSKSKNDFQFDIGPVKINNMKMTFQDENLPIAFKTNVTDLKGSFSRLNSSSSKPTKLELEGKVDKYGYTKISGIVDINDIKLLTDTNLLFKNIAIKNFTPYSGKFLGRAIESGKLNLDLKYNIKKSDLNAQNSVIISDIKLGDKVESPDAVNLPLELAIALLEDSDGIIDLDLPITGNVDDPQFSIAPIVWKVFTNLIVKAITSPFALLGALLGIDEEKIKSVEFTYGKSDILASEKESLDNIAKLLSKKPKLAIKIKPVYSPTKDKVALQDIKFEKFLIKKMKKIPEGDEYKEALEEIYTKLDDVKKLDEIKKSYTKKDKMGKEFFNNDAYVEFLRKFLASKQEISEKELISLVENRIKNIQDYLFVEKKVQKDSIIIEKISKQSDENLKWAIFNFDVASK